MKYDALRKIERNWMVYHYWLEHKQMSYREIGIFFPVDNRPLSPSRISRIIKKQRELEEAK